FPSLRDIYLHCLVCVDGIVNNILQGDSSFPRINYDDYDSIEKMQEYVTQVESKATENLKKITREELSRKIERKRRDGSTTIATVEDYIIHLFQEETHHRGELIALLWQMDVRPPHMGWTQYINK
ncbi:DinB family protein, partial [Candidatus Bathyarchaeota archaeon]|nr:DinB family protein [Candidatus Bathyarchaeota archaeon]